MADQAPIPMLLWCPACGRRHVDVGEFATRSHHAHACQHCGMVWRPAVVATVGVQFLPGFKDGQHTTERVMPKTGIVLTSEFAPDPGRASR